MSEDRGQRAEIRERIEVGDQKGKRKRQRTEDRRLRTEDFIGLRLQD